VYNLQPIGQTFKDKEADDFFLPFEMGKHRLPETSASNMPEYGRTHPPRCGSLKSSIFLFALFSDAFKLNIAVDGTVLMLQ
jgi:hypothetical protein